MPQRGVAGDGTIPLLDNVNCQGMESNLLGCHHDGIGQQSCNGSINVAGVICRGMYKHDQKIAYVMYLHCLIRVMQ